MPIEKPSRRKRIYFLAAILSCVLLIWTGSFVWDMHSKANAISTVCDWARLAPLPASASHLAVTSEGSAFTREFIVEFDAPPRDVEAWLKTSPGPAVTIPTVDGQRRHFAITPGGGAGFAELDYDESKGHVRIRAYWS